LKSRQLQLESACIRRVAEGICMLHAIDPQNDDAVIDDVKPWGRWATLGLGAIALLAGQLVALTTLTWWTGQGLAQWVDFAGDGVAVTLTIFISTPVLVVLLALMARQKCASAAEYLGLTLPRKRDVVFGIIAVLIFIVAIDGISWLFGHNIVTNFQLDIYRTASAAGWLAWLWLAVVVITPIGEEALFRGFLFRGWHRSSHDAWVAIAVTAILWAIIHLQYDFYVIAQVFACGLIFGWFRWATGSTILTMLLHGLVNCEGMFETFIALRS
jgi:membrane protease YdiL (CAAX protease family)